MSAPRIMLRLSLGCVWMCLLIIGSAVLAQSDATPISIGQNAFGELTAEANTARYSVTAAGGETATIQVLALSAGFVPRFRVVNPAGVEILVVSNPAGLNSLTGNASFPDAGDYRIEIAGENGTLGQFALSLQTGGSLPEAVELAADQPVTDTVGSDTPVHVYHFSTTAETFVLTILSELPDTGALVSLYDEAAGKTIATNDAGVSGVAYRLPTLERGYRVEVRAGGEAGDTTYTICFGACGSSPLAAETTADPGAVAVNETPEAVAATCMITSNTGGSINVRSAPGTQFAVIGNLAAGQTYPALGQLAGGGWYQVNANGQIGWVAASVTRLDGECSNLAVVAAPANAALASTQAPPPTNPPPLPGGGSGSTPTATSTIVPSATPTTVQLPDLTVRIDSFFIDGAGAAHIDYTMSNIGSAPNVSPFILMLCVDLTCTTYNITENMASGTSSSGTTIRNEWEADPLATFPRATVTIDSGGNIAESNESNNSATAFPQ